MPPKPYTLNTARPAQKDIPRLQTKIQGQVRSTIRRLIDTLNQGQRPQDIKPIKGQPDIYRIDSGEYRIIFELDDAARNVTILRVRHRKDAYRDY